VLIDDVHEYSCAFPSEQPQVVQLL